MTQRNPSARVTGMMQEQYSKEYRTAMRWDMKYKDTWQELNPGYQSPSRSPRNLRASPASQVSPPASRPGTSALPPVGRMSLNEISPAPPSPTAADATSPSPLSRSYGSVSPNSRLNSSHRSVSGASNSNMYCDRRVFHNLRFSDARKEFYDQFIAKPKYQSWDRL